MIVLDRSLSMGYRSSESSRFDQAKAVATQIVKDARGGDSVSVIMMGDPPKVVIGDPTNNLRRGRESDRQAGASPTAAPIWRPRSRRSTESWKFRRLSRRRSFS